MLDDWHFVFASLSAQLLQAGKKRLRILLSTEQRDYLAYFLKNASSF